MLRGGQLGNIRGDDAHFTFSRKSVVCLIETFLAINKVHIALIMEQKIIRWQFGTKISAKNNACLGLFAKLAVMAKCPNSYKIVKTCTVQGGLSHIGVERALKERLKSLSVAERTVLSLGTALSTIASNTLGVL
jgi:hypothetical protein